jgi:multidrug efflux system membrane fusion protein
MILLRRVVCSAVAALVVSPALAADVPAVLDWARRVQLTTPVSGVVAEVPARPGQWVTKGAVLVRLSPRSFQAHVAEREAAVKREQELLSEAGREFERAQELYDRTLLSEHDLQMARIGRVSAEARLQAAEAGLTLARLDLELSQVTAPFDGLVVERRVEPGQVIVTRFQGVPMVTLAQANPMVARARVAEAMLDRLHAGDVVEVRIDGTVLSGKVRGIGLEPVQSTDEGPLYELRVAVPLTAGRIPRAGRSVVLRLP